MKNNLEQGNYHAEDSNFEKQNQHANDLRLWESFQRDSRNRTVIILGYTTVLAVLALIFKNVWLILIGAAALWVIVFVWYTWKKKTRSIDDNS
ncbi:hypothetical protein Ava_2816 [Trichormus variabilis ATCC 29413]|uniref:Uncharacterized protein n=2 Tax=Anabaena variabilis TaxID=264691 RepID=Q3M9A7_TRIV2|nr:MULTISPECIES: hypothetical protein [Nostocaceae]ABA22429.1 hypothetical protein Ava_2816 [Trichormus variabilis ATCC 29413]MBC1215256.1 hypothetical protein [Trichormus variabilis ARAD]MBC1256661.1 hypothetical protein [Trichormus variabilis V5]MBC1267192.1 hypothetical protein [Trichormus variabilis FSR]MBC1303295.1 hypothetical protein [Trichormus variabilis N2B]